MRETHTLTRRGHVVKSHLCAARDYHLRFSLSYLLRLQPKSLRLSLSQMDRIRGRQ